MVSWAAATQNDLSQNLQSLSLDERCSSHSYSASITETGSGSLTPTSSRQFSIAESTTRSSVDLDNTSQASAAGAANAKDELGHVADDRDVDTGNDASDSESFSGTDSAEEPTPPRDIPALPGRIGVELLIQRLLEAYESHRQLTSTNRKGGGGSSANATQESSEKASSSALPSGKRPFQDADETFTEGTGNEPIPAVKKQKTADQPDKTFACPFWKKDPRKNPGCFRHELKRVNRVKQHLKTKHKIPIRCPKCQRSFENRPECYEHIRQTACEKLPMIVDEGISEEQVQALAAKGKADLTQEQRWYRIWNIIFPGVPSPSSPYRDEGMAEGARDALQFYNENGRTILLDHMREAVDWSPGDDEARFNSPWWQPVWDGFFEDMERRFMTRLNENEAMKPNPPAPNTAPLDMSPVSAQGDGGEEEDDATGNEPTEDHTETSLVIEQGDTSDPAEAPSVSHSEDTMWDGFDEDPLGLFTLGDADVAASGGLDAQDDMTGSGYVPFPSNFGRE
ncbi:hypothetical protein GQ53DRAFT_768230 [Thozetella sp. PMI_491]|nr:hypothetical protein GQ53DRAFT_768230 [Thozetella sp. PMI_491]